MGATNRPEQEARLAQAMSLAQAGDAAAYRELLEAVNGILRLYVGRVLGRMGLRAPSTEQDLVQEVLLALHEKRQTYDPRYPFLPWLFAIARYKVIDFGRRERRRGAVVAIESVEDALAAPVFMEASTAGDLEAIVGTLPNKSRALLESVKIEGLSIAEAAARAQMNESAVKVAIHRALKTLRKRVREGNAV